MHLDWRISPLEWKTIRYFTEHIKHAFADLDLANIIPRPELAAEEGFRDVVVDDSHHHMGGARMAAHAAEGVVDPNLRLHGVQNVFLCSASVFPTSGFSNPTHTLIALAIRLADYLVASGDANNKINVSSRPDPERSEGEVEGPAFSSAPARDRPNA